MSRFALLTDAQWDLIEEHLPCSDGRPGRPFRDSRQVVDGIIYRYRTGMAWRDLPEVFGPWQTVWKRHKRYAQDGTWDQLLTVLIAEADARGIVDWTVSVDSTINRAHQHSTNTTRDTGGTCRTTRIWASSRLITASDGPAAGCRPRSTNSSTAPGAR